MPVVEKNGLMKYKDKSGNTYILYPVTNTENVDGLDEMVDEAKKLDTAVAATSTDGVAYSATVPGITALTAGDSFIMIPDKLSTSRSTTLNVNNLGAKLLRVRVSGYSGTTSAAQTTNWLAPNVPVRVTYYGNWWAADVILPSAQQLYGNVQAEQVDYSNTNSGMTATDVQAAIDELAGNKTSTQVLTTAEYNALTDKNENVLYMLSDAEDEDNAVMMGSNTVAVTAPTDIYLTSVCYGNGMFVAVNTYGAFAAYSTDSITWTKTTLPISTVWNWVCYGNGKFVAVASNTNIAAYSEDGINWTQITMPASEYWRSVCYGDGKFVAVAENIAAYSEDGITWTQATAMASGNWYSVCYGDGKFVAVTHDDNVSAYSEDAITWTQTTFPTSGDWDVVSYGNGKFVALNAKTNANLAAYSTDGITWTQTTLPTSQYWQSMCYGGGKFVMVANHNNIAIYSEDGITWTQTTFPVSPPNTNSICYADSKFVVLCIRSIIAYSTDGINWTNEAAVPALQNSAGEDISEDVKNVLAITAEDVGADAKGSAEQALTDAKVYTDQAIANIPSSGSSNQITYGTEDLTAGTSALETGTVYFVYG